MRVTFTTVEDFCRELDREAANGYVWRRQVRSRIDRGAEQDDQITFAVAIWGTAIITTPEGDYLAEYGELCGTDDEQRGAKEPTAGTDAAKARQAKIASVCERHGLQMVEGKFETN